MLEDNEKKGLQEYFDKVAVVQDLDVNIVVDAFEQAMKLVMETPAGSELPRFALIDRAKSVLDSKFDNEPKEGVEFDFVLFGPYQSPKDWADVIFKEIVDGINEGKIKELCDKGLLMTYEGEPVSKINAATTRRRYLVGTQLQDEQTPDSVAIDEVVILDAEIWEKGEGMPIFRDNRLYNGAFPNKKGYSKELQHNWNLNLVGMAWPKGKRKEARLFETVLKWGQADPTSDEFFFNRYEAFTPYSASFTVKKDKTTPYKFHLETNKLTPTGLDLPMETFDINLRKFLDGLRSKYGDLEDIPVFLNGLANIRDYHKSACKLKEDGTIATTKSGWHAMKWNKYAILSTNCSGRGDPDKNNRIKYYFSDSSINEQFSGKTVKGMVAIHPKKIPGRCIMLIKTGWSPQAWDPLVSQFTYQPNNKFLKIDIYSIKSVGIEVDLSKIKIKGLN